MVAILSEMVIVFQPHYGICLKHFTCSGALNSICILTLNVFKLFSILFGIESTVQSSPNFLCVKVVSYRGFYFRFAS